MERKSTALEFKDLDTASRTGIIAHAAFGNIDRTGDISTKGMFTKSWKESKGAIDFLFNHVDGDTVGNVADVYETEEKAFTQVTFGDWTLGNDVIAMAEAKVLKGASFGYETVQKEFKVVNGKKIRVLKEVKHFETSLLTKMPANPLAGLVTLKKSIGEIKSLSDLEKQALMSIVLNDQQNLEKLIQLSGNVNVGDDLYTWVLWNISRRAESMADIRSTLRYNAREMGELKAHAQTLEAFCRNTKASDECIKHVQADLEETKSIISQYDTATTTLITEPGASRTDNDSLKTLLLINSSF